jgi:hypothetical protein
MDYLRCGVLYVVYQQDVIDIAVVEGKCSVRLVSVSGVCFLSLVGIFLQQYLKWEIP